MGFRAGRIQGKLNPVRLGCRSSWISLLYSTAHVAKPHLYPESKKSQEAWLCFQRQYCVLIEILNWYWVDKSNTKKMLSKTEREDSDCGKCHTHSCRIEQEGVVGLGTDCFVSGGIPERLCETKQDSAGYGRAGPRASGISFHSFLCKVSSWKSS